MLLQQRASTLADDHQEFLGWRWNSPNKRQLLDHQHHFLSLSLSSSHTTLPLSKIFFFFATTSPSSKWHPHQKKKLWSQCQAFLLACVNICVSVWICTASIHTFQSSGFLAASSWHSFLPLLLTLQQLPLLSCTIQLDYLCFLRSLSFVLNSFPCWTTRKTGEE